MYVNTVLPYDSQHPEQRCRKHIEEVDHACGDNEDEPDALYAELPVFSKLVVKRCRDVLEENDFVLTPEDFRNAITDKTVAVIINSPNNPTGAVYGREALEGISDIVKKNNLTIIWDECYKSLLYDGAQYVSILDFPDMKDYSRKHEPFQWLLSAFYAHPVESAVRQIDRLTSRHTAAYAFGILLAGHLFFGVLVCAHLSFAAPD